MDINIIIKKTAVYTILSTSIIGIYIATILVFESLFHNLTGITSLTIRIVAGFLITATFQPLRSRIEIIIDKLFFRGKLDYQEAISEFTRSLVTVLDLRELLNLIVSMSGLLNTRQVVIFLFDETSAQYKIRASTGLDRIAKEIAFNTESDLVKLLTTTRKVALRSTIDSSPAYSGYTILRTELDSLQAVIAIPILVKDMLKGILLLGEKLSEEPYSKEDINMLTTLADEASIAIDNAQLYEEQKRTYLETVQALAQAIEASDEYTRGHSDRVTKFAIQIARQLQLGRTFIDTLKIACILHDVGKIGIIKEVLNKPGKLNDAEFDIIKMHPVLGEQIIAPVAFLAPIKPIVRHHHERFDGRGYPDGLKGEIIPYLSRIIAVADTYDAMTSERPYRPALSTEIALAEIRKCSGTQFDPEVVKAFLEIHPTLQL
ncbi:MAG: HD domain-containing protein [bacterium]|nr:HD domain-containing protein [bacterium]